MNATTNASADEILRASATLRSIYGRLPTAVELAAWLAEAAR